MLTMKGPEIRKGNGIKPVSKGWAVPAGTSRRATAVTIGCPASTHTPHQFMSAVTKGLPPFHHPRATAINVIAQRKQSGSSTLIDETRGGCDDGGNSQKKNKMNKKRAGR